MQAGGDRGSVELHYDEMGKLTPDQVQELFSWVLERVDLLSFWNSEPSVSSPIETLSFTSDGESVVPAGAWKAHLMQCSATSSTGNDAEPDDHLLLEWVYGLVVPMQEKAVEGAKRALFQGQAPDGVQLWSLLKAVRPDTLLNSKYILDILPGEFKLFLERNLPSTACRRTGKMQSLQLLSRLERHCFMKCLHVARKYRSS